MRTSKPGESRVLVISKSLSRSWPGAKKTGVFLLVDPEGANGSASLKDLIDSPSFFPFRIKPVHAENLVAASSRLDLLRHGLDDDLVMLRKQTTKGGAP